MADKISPSRAEYERLRGKYPVVPVWKHVPAAEADPIRLFEGMPPSEHSFILESAEKGGQTGKYSFVGSAANKIEFYGKEYKKGRSPLRPLRDYMAAMMAPGPEELPPFAGGAVGYAGYGLVNLIEKLPSSGLDDIRMPVYSFMLAEDVFVFDHVKNSVLIVVNPSGGSYEEAAEKIAGMERIVHANGGPRAPRNITAESAISSNFSERDFAAAVEKAKEYIREGEIFQAVLSQRLSTKLASPPLMIYRTLRKINPSPYMFCLKMGDDYLIGSSPETHVKAIGDRVTIRPIAGTRPRGATPEEDAFLEKDLLSDEKERAEHLMLVDLARNDIGRISVPGTVEVDDFMKVYRYSHVMHIESNVIGRLGKDSDRFDAFECTFPAGTVSGAPKVRAMEIIDELEPTARGPYAGAVGYFSYSGNMDTCITIRTILIRGSDVHVQAGAGIVADSLPEKEYAETMNKAKALLKALSDSRSPSRGNEP